MIRLLAAVLLFASVYVVAEVTLTDINNNEVADAEEVMGNFNVLKEGVEANATAIYAFIDALAESEQLCAAGFSSSAACANGTYSYQYGSDGEAEWWGRPNANPNCGENAGFFVYTLDSKWVVGTGLGGSSGVIATCDAATFVGHPTQCGSNWVEANDSPIEGSFSSGDCGDRQLADLNCSTDQIIKWNGSAWACATDPFAGLNYNVGDQLRLGNNGWECSEAPLAATLTQDSWSPCESEPCFDSFDSMSNVEVNLTFCSVYDYCVISVIGVADHNNCITQVSGNAVSQVETNISPSVGNIRLSGVDEWYRTGRVYINIFCAH